MIIPSPISSELHAVFPSTKIVWLIRAEVIKAGWWAIGPGESALSGPIFQANPDALASFRNQTYIKDWARTNEYGSLHY